jgi:glycosyltransferase involved in cell wall biosynthesis
VRRRLLIVTPYAPSAGGRHGGARVVHGLVGELSRRHDVALLHLDRDELDPVIAARCASVDSVALADPGPWGVRARGAGAVLRGRSLKAAASAVPRLRRRVRELARSFDAQVVQVETGILGDALAGAPHALRVVTFYEPAGSLRESLGLRSRGLPFAHSLDAIAAQREERRVLGLADIAVAFTERDRRLLGGGVGGGAERVTIGFGWDVPETACDPAGGDPPTLLFVANFAHPPNVDAALTLARRILPAVRSAHPAVRLEIVGAAPPAELLALAGDAIRVTGAVPSVRPYLERAAVVVTPIALGGGMRAKVLEALAAGKAVVASSRAAEGITARPGEELVVVDGDPQTAAAICALLEDEEARRRMAARARAWALRELSWPAVADRYDELYARCERREAR